MQFAYPADPSNGAQNGLSPTIVQRRITTFQAHLVEAGDAVQRAAVVPHYALA